MCAKFKSKTHLLNQFFFIFGFCVFWYPYWIFVENFFLLLLLAFFQNFECKCSRDSLKKQKTFFYKRVLKFN